MSVKSLPQDQKITIFHATDLHMREASVEHIKRRVAALSKYISAEDLNPDLIVFSGDAAFAGTADEYALAETHFFKPVRSALRVPEKHVILVPGNHDVDRTQISVPELDALRKLSNTQEAGKELEKAASGWKRTKSYQSFVEEKRPGANSSVTVTSFFGGLAHATLLEIRGIKIGIAGFNSAWLCANDSDKGNLFLTETQVQKVCDAIDSCHLRIAVVHHPLDWLNTNDITLAGADLKRRFHMLLSGHLHEPFSTYQKDPSGELLTFAGRAFFDGKTEAKVEDGFHVYTIDLGNRKIEALYRRYIRTRDTFDKDTEHAQDGRCEFPLTIPETVFAAESLVVQKLASEGNVLQLQVRKELSLIQGTENPVFVAPKLCPCTFKEGKLHKDQTNYKLTDLGERNTILLGGSDSGKTILLKSFVGDAQSEPGGAKSRIPVYLDFAKSPSHTREGIMESVQLALGDIVEADLHSLKVVLVIDGINSSEIETCLIINDICDIYKWTSVIAISRTLIGPSLYQDEKLKEFLFIEIQPWGPSRIRELAVRLFEGTNTNVDLAYQCVCRSLEESDLPATPTIVSLYMSVFPKLGNHFSGITFLRLLQKIEQIRLGENEAEDAYTLYYRNKILQKFAIKCFEIGSLEIPQSEAVNIITSHFNPFLMRVEPTRFIDDLCASGFIKRENGLVAFSHFVFFDYYLSLTLESGLLKEEEHTADFDHCVRVAHSLALFAGLARANHSLANRVLKVIEQSFPSPPKKTLCDLDSYIQHLLFPSNNSARAADQIASDDLKDDINYDGLDEDHQKTRAQTLEHRERLLKGKGPVDFGIIASHVDGLHAFYNIFKNLEEIDGELKILLLDRILDYHIITNFYLIDFYSNLAPNSSIRSVAAYMLTLSGHTFMASALGCHTLIDAIKRTIDTVDNDFKEFLLILLLSDLRDADSLECIENFLTKTESVAATEILYFHLRQRMIMHDAKIIPVDLIAAFKTAYQKRETLYNTKKSKGAQAEQFNVILKAAKKEHDWKRSNS